MEQLVANPLFALFAVVASGLLLGQVRVAGLSLGSSAVIFTALAAGHFGMTLPGDVGTFGLVLFVYSIGLTAGPSFFRVFRQQGKSLALLATVLVVAGAGSTYVFARLLSIPADLAAGLFAGAMTSTPGLAAVLEVLPAGGQAAVGYGIAYPFGVIGVVLLVQLLPRLLKLDLDALDRELSAEERGRLEIRTVLVEALNPAVLGKRLAELEMIAMANCQVTRVMRGDRLVPVPQDYALQEGDCLLLVGRSFRLDPIVALLGRLSDRTDYVVDTQRNRMQIVATLSTVVGKSIGELRLLSTHGVTVSRFTRHDVEFVPDPDDVVQWGDALQVVGEPDDLARFAEFAGHRAHAFDQTDLVSVGLGIVTGVVLGTISLGLGDGHFSLGLVGGPMLVALLVGHFGRIGRIYGSVPRASRLLMMELGLVLFLADAGMGAGGTMISVLFSHGWQLIVAAIGVTIIPMAIGMVFATRTLGMNFLETLGGVCGGMTSTPGLGALTARTDSDIPVVGYAAAYPVALILMTAVGHLLVGLLG